MRYTDYIIFLSIFAAIFSHNGDMTKESKTKKTDKPTEWILSKLIEKPVQGISIKGKTRDHRK